MSTEEGNKLIAEFMGLQFKEPHGIFNLPQYWSGDDSDGRKKGSFIGYPHQLKYHSSWDWLMPAVKKWNDLVISKRNDKKGWMKWQYKTVMLRTSIEPVFKDLVESIIWYNN